MAFLENDGDLIMDAVLTDTGRMRLAKADGSFNIVKFALGDDEIDYSLYDKNHSSGSAYYDIEILSSPVLEAFTNNASSMKSKLISIPRNNLLFLPILLLDETSRSTQRHTTLNAYVVAVNEDSESNGTTVGSGTGVAFDSSGQQVTGVMLGESITDNKNSVKLIQGLNTENRISAQTVLDADLIETQYILEIDNRLGSIISAAGSVRAPVSFIDDDQTASYYLTLGRDPSFISDFRSTSTKSTGGPMKGPRGTVLEFSVQSSLDLASSDYLFNTLGSTATMTNESGDNQSVKYIDTMVRVTGYTTGYRIDIPFRFVKLA